VSFGEHLQKKPIQEEYSNMFGLGIPELFVLLIIVAVMIIPFWQIFKKAGFSPALSILMIIPLANIVMIFFLAFAAWPIHKQLQK
jgi:hypothetical protein